MTAGTLDTSAVEKLGFRVEECTNEEREHTGYFLFGPRGAHYALMRTDPRPDVMFAIHAREGKFGVVKVRGYSYFTDRGGVLKPLY